MAEWRKPDDFDGVPPSVLEYDKRLHGGGDSGVRAWRTEAVAWLRDHPGKELPCGGSLEVFRVSRDLLLNEWFGYGL